jgi:hypothetical protein
MITRTLILAAISETMLEIITYAFLAFGALALVALIAYAVLVFRRLTAVMASVDTTMQSVAGLMDASAPVVARLHDSILRVEKLLAADRSGARPPAPDTDQPTQAMCVCGGVMAVVKATVVEDRSMLTLGCRRCHRTTDVPLV